MMTAQTHSTADRIHELFKAAKPPDITWLDWLIQHQLDQLPQPGQGATLARWQALAAVGQFDLSVAKHFEGHTDALAILGELGEARHCAWPGAWCVWASESPGARCTLHELGNGNSCVTGVKLWCSGALTASQALLTAWHVDTGAPHLVAVRLAHPGIKVDAGHWQAVGMADSQSVQVALDNVACTLIGTSGAYLQRPGFWQGGAGVAACWLGGTLGIAQMLEQSLRHGVHQPPHTSAAQSTATNLNTSNNSNNLNDSNDSNNSNDLNKSNKSNNPDLFKLAALGKVYLAIAHTSAMLRSAAAFIDQHPQADARRVALAARLSAEQSAQLVIREVGQALGASPFCLNEKFARAAADLPVFIRQSHGDKDFAALGERVCEAAPAWTL